MSLQQDHTTLSFIFRTMQTLHRITRLQLPACPSVDSTQGRRGCARSDPMVTCCRGLFFIPVGAFQECSYAHRHQVICLGCFHRSLFICTLSNRTLGLAYACAKVLPASESSYMRCHYHPNRPETHRPHDDGRRAVLMYAFVVKESPEDGSLVSDGRRLHSLLGATWWLRALPPQHKCARSVFLNRRGSAYRRLVQCFPRVQFRCCKVRFIVGPSNWYHVSTLVSCGFLVTLMPVGQTRSCEQVNIKSFSQGSGQGTKSNTETRPNVWVSWPSVPTVACTRARMIIDCRYFLRNFYEE